MYFFVGNALFEMKKFKNAIPYLDRLIRQQCNDPEIYYKKAHAQNECGMYLDALKGLKKGAYPDDADIHYEMGRTYINMGKFRRSIIYKKRAIRADPQHGGVYVCLAISYAKTGQHRLARRCVNRAQKLFPKVPKVLKLLKILRNKYGYK